MKHLSTEMKQRQQLDWRRAQVLELASQEYSQREIALLLIKASLREFVGVGEGHESKC
ncbi:MAG: hypothetical protein QN716_07885 [Nitrososphaeraceae archaeon]|nr:hypothetical protein [Nitrososphaeraceae archaeon]